MPRKPTPDSGIELDLGRYELRRNGRRLKLEKKPMELLIFLVSHRDQLVSRKEIIAKLWRSNLFIDTEPNINNIIRKIRAALGDDSGKPRFLETVVGKGYRFVGPIRVIDARFPASGSDWRATSPVPPEGTGHANERASLAVLPLLLLGKSADDHGICLGFADALITRLGNLPGLDVLPISAVMNLPAVANASETASRLGVRFVLHGAIQMSKSRWQLSLEMWDTHTQNPCFARKRDLDLNRLPEFEDEISRQIALSLNRPVAPVALQRRPRHSKDPMAYAEFMRGYRLSSSGDPASLEEAALRLSNAVTRDPAFSLAHATLSLVCATRHYELDPTSESLEKAEFHCRRALELDPDLPEGHVANAFLLWGPSKNFQHVEAIAELKRALALQNNQPQAYNRLGTILAHIGLLDHARAMYERGRHFHPRKTLSHSIVQVYLWNGELDLAREELSSWRAENPGNKYPLFFAPQLAMMTGEWKEAKTLLDEGVALLPEEPLIGSLLGLFFAMTGKAGKALDCLTRACAIPKSFGHAHHSYYQFACILAVLERREAAFEWLQRSVSNGFACWPFFLSDPCLKNLRELPAFDVLVSSLQARYPDHLGLL
ncbi:MAG TPA: winged helix-turn-helix domain-containing protein [Candidatus Baltobacteraceae bacterium]|nr:winged helix-turn-helix domain-containing protein [Candidatus Baltobacteraceae bacterium]